MFLSGPEDNPNALAMPRCVEEVFERVCRVLELRVDGQTIRTTHEHPFYVEGKGWTQACALLPGDLLKSHDGRTFAVESLTDTSDDVTVYNMRIEEYHTYFVGDAAWGFSVWAHNANCAPGGGDKIIEDTSKSQRALKNAANSGDRAAIEAAEHQANGIQDAQKDFWKRKRNFNRNIGEDNELPIKGINY